MPFRPNCAGRQPEGHAPSGRFPFMPTPSVCERNLFNDLEKGLPCPWARSRTQKARLAVTMSLGQWILSRLKASAVVEF